MRNTLSTSSFVTSAMFVAFLHSFGVAHASAAETVDASALIVRLEGMSNMLVENPQAEELRTQYKALADELTALGAQGRPAILARLASLENPFFRRELTFVLGEIAGEASDRELIRLLCFDDSSEVKNTALVQLLHRAELRGPLSFALSEKELNTLVEMTLKIARESHYAGSLMRLLGFCAQNDVQTRFAPILTLFQEQVHFEGPFPRIKDSYLSPRVYMLNGFLLTFAHMGETVWEPLREARKKALKVEDAEFAKWLCLGLGFAGDPSVAQCTESVVLHDSDPYVRCVAIEAYVCSAGEAAIPVLETLADDKTESEYSTNPWPFYVIGGIARANLRILEQSKKEREAAAEEKTQP